MKIIEYPDTDIMMMDVANVLAEDLSEALHTKDRVTLAVPGGTTPGPVFDALSAVDLPWERVDVMLTDERWVPEDHERSNTALVKARLVTNRAVGARFFPFFAPAEKPEDVLADIEAALIGAMPVDIAVLGMGADMHTASLFPDSDGLEAALAADAPVLVPVRKAGLPDVRVTLSARVLDGAMRKHVLIKGDDKKEALVQARGLSPREAPIKAVLDGAQIHWSKG
ncbi:6-phosphogluconolactonase [Shimia isoporae]|uniref:6-phosphogluconolactonase n=1 Tax=Shimia isoporae TaxID=647720 RepID=A0A4R1NMJ3_9RHOB|nr:6-phosphogluconolactonase [Shimia isoporae]TCL09385.1 6-phosphogluconolactonase [Shimia isoporae]